MSPELQEDFIDSAGFRANVGIILTRPSGELFLGGRIGGRGWQFPQGGVRRGESIENALFRELHEEVGLERDHVRVLGATQGWLRYRLPKQYVRDRCIGQKQRWYLLQFTADESRLRFDACGLPEFDRWRWVDFWAPVREVVYFKRKVYVKALHELGRYLFADALPPYPDWWEECLAPPSLGRPPGARRTDETATDAQGRGGGAARGRPGSKDL